MSQHVPSVRLELAAALLVPSAAFGFVRVFDDSSAVLPVIGASLLSTAVAIGARRARLPLLVAAVVSLGALTVLVVNRYAPGSARFGVLPTTETRAILRVLFDDGLAQFRELRAPVETLDPFVAAALIATWVMSFLTDWGALRLRLAFEPVLPAALLFVFSAVLGSGQRQIVATVVFAGAVLIWAVVQRVDDLATNSIWLTADRRRGPMALARNGAIFGVVAVLLGAVAGPRLPGASSEELYSWRNQGDPVRSVISPYVNIEARLVTQTNTQLFTVRSDRPSYWRLAGLDSYENGLWSTRGTFREESGDLPGLGVNAGTTLTVTQEFTIDSLAEIWLPAAFAPSRVESESDVSWNADSGSLTVDNSRPTSDGITYTVESTIALFTPDELRAAPPAVPVEIAERYLPLPDDLTDRVANEAAAITAGATTNYDRMLALQEYFRAFDYDVQLSERVGDPIEQFLDERVGFCQQFSGTFALMARSLGIPSRVAVGFTWGDPVDGEPGLYRITGRQTHAWPEIWFTGLGWVAFEPTPGRGAPDATYNPVTARQDSLVQPDQPGQPTTTTSRPDNDLAAPRGPEPDFDPTLGLPELGAANDGTSGSQDRSLSLRVLAVASVIGLYVVGLPFFHRLRRARRSQAAETPAERIDVAWANATEAIELHLGMLRPGPMTRQDWATKLASDMRVPSEPMSQLGHWVTIARYGNSVLTEQDAGAAETASSEIVSTLKSRRSWWERLRSDLDPRRLRRPTARTLARQG